MGKVKRVPTERVSYRWSALLTREVESIMERTGWNESKSSAFLVRAGLTGLYTRSGCKAEREELADATRLHNARTKAAAIVADAEKAVRAKRRSAKEKAAAAVDGPVGGPF